MSVRKVLGVNIGDSIDIIHRADGTISIHNGQPIPIEEFAGSLGPPRHNRTLAEYLGEVDRQSMVRPLYEETEFGLIAHDEATQLLLWGDTP